MPDETREFALLCPRCGEENPPGFPVCWSCNEDLPAPAETAEEAPTASVATPQRDPGARAARRKRIGIEVATALAIVWVPPLSGGLLEWLDPRPRTLPLTLVWLASGLGFLLFLWYLAWLDGDWRRFFGLRRPRGVDVLWGAGAMIAMLVAVLSAHRLAVALHFEHSGSPPALHEDGLRWIAPLDYLVWALVEEAFYRAYLWKRFAELSGRPGLSIVVASVLFSVSHGYPLEGTLAVFLTGLALGWIFRARQSLWAVVLGHWAYNLFLTG